MAGRARQPSEADGAADRDLQGPRGDRPNAGERAQPAGLMRARRASLRSTGRSVKYSSIMTNGATSIPTAMPYSAVQLYAATNCSGPALTRVRRAPKIAA